MGQRIIKVRRVIEYEGPEEWVERTLRHSILATPDYPFRPKPNASVRIAEPDQRSIVREEEENKEEKKGETDETTEE